MDTLERVDNDLSSPMFAVNFGISSATFHKWQAKYGGMDTSDDGSDERARS